MATARAVSITYTFEDALSVTQSRVPSGVTATAKGWAPVGSTTGMVVGAADVTALAVSITDTVPEV
jgi:hypothetical protein